MNNNEILLKTLQKENEILKTNFAKVKDERYRLEQENTQIREQLEKILYSRSYKLMQKIVKIFKRHKD